MRRKLLITERKIIWRTVGPTKERDGTYRIKISDESYNLIRNKIKIYYIIAQKLSWFGHVDWMTNDRVVKKLYVCEKLMYSRLAGSPKTRGENDIKKV